MNLILRELIEKVMQEVYNESFKKVSLIGDNVIYFCATVSFSSFIT